jgi:MoCo/4Fe-4S cofactor protein with predicted Tat translocation signal
MSNNQYWKGLEELNKTPEFSHNQRNEFMEGIPMNEAFNEETYELSSTRRDFLKYFGFTVSSAAILAACNRAPIRNVIPYAFKPSEVVAGTPNWYSSTCNACSAGCGTIVKVREGRPVKVEGNPDNKINNGALCAVGHAELLSLYDKARYEAPLKNNTKTDISTIDKEVGAALDEIKAANGEIVILSNTINSPSTLAAIHEFTKKYPTTKHIQYEEFSSYAMIAANEKSFGKALLPSYHFDKANVIVSFGADFLGTWISPVQFTQQYTSGRKAVKGMSRHIQFETNLSLTGSNADVRIPITPSQEGVYLLNLYNKIASGTGAPSLPVSSTEAPLNMIENTAKELLANQGKSLVVSGSNDIDIQLLVNAINTTLGNVGTTIDFTNYSKQKMSNDVEMEQFVADLNDGKISAVIVYGANPSYNYYNADKFNSGLKKAKLSLSFATSHDETSAVCTYVMPDHHSFESWNDHEAIAGQYSLNQPTISPIFYTRQAQESLLVWAGITKDYYSFIKENWAANFKDLNFNAVLEKGYIEGPASSAMIAVKPATGKDKTEKAKTEAAPKAESKVDLGAVASNLAKTDADYKGKLQVILYEKVGVRDGRMSNNPWLQELPDPISKITWDNYVASSIVYAGKNNLEDGNLVTLKGGNVSTEIPFLRQPGQANNTISVAVGYGRPRFDKAGTPVEVIGKNVYGMVSFVNGAYSYISYGATIDKAPGTYTLAQTQTHHTLEGRDHYRSTSLSKITKNPKAFQKQVELISLWEERDYRGHKWVMAVDLNACTGCGSCVVACNNENNVPVVGRDQVMRGREMHWMRIDRYFTFTEFSENGSADKYRADLYKDLKVDSDHDGVANERITDEQFENVAVGFQPMMCQHCGHAPCETVCPVLATTHSGEGLNQMTYNRCIGTKYCANNCPYKVRRFNWYRFNDNDKFDYQFNNDLGKMVINPDVTVRTRGVMEKCSFCVQRIQDAKLLAKRENRTMIDGDVKTACQQTCPSGAIVFGDINDKTSEVYKLFNEERSYHVLEEIGVQPSVKYQGKIRNTFES